MAVAVEVDLFVDLRALVASRLVADGYTVEPSEDACAVVTKFLQIQHRRVPVQPRRVNVSTALRARGPQLPEWIQRALVLIERAFEAGDDMNPYLSRQLAS